MPAYFSFWVSIIFSLTSNKYSQKIIIIKMSHKMRNSLNGLATSLNVSVLITHGISYYKLVSWYSF